MTKHYIKFLYLFVLIFVMGWASPAIINAQISITDNKWKSIAPSYTGAPNGGYHSPQRWNNKGDYNPSSKSVLIYDRWYDTLRKGSIYANTLLSFDAYTNKVSKIV